MEKTKTKIIGKIIKFTILGLFVGLALTVLVGYLFGYKAFIVDGASMEPIIDFRALAIDKVTPASEIEIGDAVTYSSGPGYVTHRVVQVKNESSVIIAEFRDMANYEASWEQNGAYIVDRSDLGLDVVAWYSGEEFNQNMTFVTQGTDRDINPFVSQATLENIDYDRIQGVVQFSIKNLGNVIIFIQRNIILVVATFASIIILYNMIYKELHKETPSNK